MDMMRYSTPMSDYEITSPTNERIKRLVRLRERSHRDTEGVFVVEGSRLFERALSGGQEPLEVYGDGSTGHSDMNEFVLVEPSVLDKASYRRTSQGLIAIFAQYENELADITLSDPGLVLVTEGLEKPGNLGAMMRTASVAGADAMITVGATTDIFNPNVIRSSTGAVFSLPVVPVDLSSLAAWLEANSMVLIATSPSSDHSMWDRDLTVPCALMVGSEDTGLSAEAIDLADANVKIPMQTSSVDSLNASVSLALVTYEALRQRHQVVGSR